MPKSFKQRFLTLGAALAVGVGFASSALAAPMPFTVDPNSITGVSGITPFQADFVNGGSSARVTANGTDGSGNFLYNSNGFINYGQFSYQSNGIAALLSGLGVQYGLYATFSQTFTCATQLNVGTQCSVDTIALTLYADVYNGNAANINTFTGATLAADPSVTDNGSNDIALGSSNLVIVGIAGIDSLGGAFENVTTNILLTTAGKSFFTAPVPFYTLAFSNFNNTSQGIACTPLNCVNPSVVAINSENGGSDFNKVPEPASLALMAVGLLAAGIGGLSRKRKV